MIGPFDNTGQNKHDVVYPPERLVDLHAEYAGKGGQTARWTTIEDDGWMMIDLKRFGDEPANTDAIAYLYREIVSEGEAEVVFEMGSDDGVKLWLNGRLIVDADVYRGMNIQDHVLELSLKPGRNTLLVKVTQGVGGWQFQMRPRLDPRIAALLGYYLERDFPLSAESAHYRLLTVLEPEGVVLEVGGLDVMPDGRPILSTRRGEVWIVDDAYDDPPLDCAFKRFAFGLHEPLGAAWRDGRLYVAQRGELTALDRFRRRRSRRCLPDGQRSVGRERQLPRVRLRPEVRSGGADVGHAQRRDSAEAWASRSCRGEAGRSS